MVVFPDAFSLTPGIVNGLTVPCADLPVGLLSTLSPFSAPKSGSGSRACRQGL